MLLSVVAPVYQEEATIERFCAAVADAARGLPFELILVDDGSTDGTLTKLEQLAAADSRIKLSAAVTQLRTPGGDHRRARPRHRQRRGDARLRPPGPTKPDPELLERWRRARTSSTRCAASRDGESRFKLGTAGLFYRLFRSLASVEPRAQHRRLPAARPPGAGRAAVDARALALPARDEHLGRFHPGLGRLRPRRPLRGQDEVHARPHAALLARRDRIVLLPAAAARHGARLRDLRRRLHRDPGRDRAQAHRPLPLTASARSRSRCCCSAASS